MHPPHSEQTPLSWRLENRADPSFPPPNNVKRARTNYIHTYIYTERLPVRASSPLSRRTYVCMYIYICMRVAWKRKYQVAAKLRLRRRRPLLLLLPSSSCPAASSSELWSQAAAVVLSKSLYIAAAALLGRKNSLKRELPSSFFFFQILWRRSCFFF